MTAKTNGFAAKCRRGKCRSCGRKGLLPVLDLGPMPLSDRLLLKDQLADREPFFPLETAFCAQCALMQILEDVPREQLFCEDYPYYSSFSQALLDHSRANALNLIFNRRLGPGSLVVEIASNDGYLLRNFVENGIPVLGVDPAEGPAAEARKIGVPTVCEFFGRDFARKLAREGKRADVTIANNVLAHVPDLNDFVEGFHVLLKDDGLAVFEFPYLRDLIDHVEFDTIYHEHMCYFSATSVDALFRRHGLFINHVERISIHGGSLRLYVQPKEAVSPSVRGLLAEELRLGVTRREYYQSFGQRVGELLGGLGKMLQELRAAGKSLAAYGAAAKGANLLNCLKAGPDLIPYVCDRNVHKQGKFMPGVHIPICDPKRILQEMPDYVLILPWNFREEIIAQQAEYRRRGGRFIIPVPSPQIV
ncbi:MAG: methyltransferase domain-containing protein [Phycisphaerae bacterium]